MSKILMVGPFPDPTTGVSLANSTLARHLAEHPNFKVSIINTSSQDFEESLGAFSWIKLWRFIRINFASIRIIKYDIIYITPGQTFFGIIKYFGFFLFSKIFKKSLVLHLHGNHLRKEFESLTGLRKKTVYNLLRTVDKGIVLSTSLKHNMEPFLRDNQIFVVKNFVEGYLFPSYNLNKESRENIRIIYVSNLMEEKGINELLDALSILESESFQYQAELAGAIDKSHFDKLNTKISRLENCEYCGIVSGEEKKSLFLWGDIFILPTYYAMEGQPISLLEAMATRNYIITTKHAGIPDIFEDGVNGAYVRKKNVSDIVSAIKAIDLDRETLVKIQLMNNAYAKENFNVKQYVDGIINVFMHK